MHILVDTNVYLDLIFECGDFSIATNNIKDFECASFPIWTPKHFNNVVEQI